MNGCSAGTCAVCEVPCSTSCAKCCAVFYCSKDHQRAHWRRHKLKCFPVRVAFSEVVGRRLIAAREIKAGEVILEDVPAVVGPKQVSEPLCLGCHARDVPLSACSKCGWPVCSERCEESARHKPECYFSTKYRSAKLSTANFSGRSYMLGCIMVLRLIFLREDDPELFGRLRTLESHVDARRKTEKYELDSVNIVQFIQKFLKIEDFSSQFIQEMIGIVDVNSFLVPSAEICALFPLASLAEHDCRFNAARKFEDDLSVKFLAVRAIARGEPVSICYTDPFWGTQNRRFHLSQTKFFLCCCVRCRDPHELGSELSTLVCSSCSRQAVVLNDPLSPVSDWSCEACGAEFSAQEVEDKLDVIGEELAALRGAPVEVLERFYFDKCSVLHRNHFYLLDVARVLLTCYESSPECSLPKRSRELKRELEKRIQLVTGLLTN